MKKTIKLIEQKRNQLVVPASAEGIFGDLARAIMETLDEIELSIRSEWPGGYEDQRKGDREADFDVVTG